MKKFYIPATFFFFCVLSSLRLNASANNNLSLLLSATVTQSNVTCNSMCNGSATVTPSGGSAPYSYQWTPFGANTAIVNGLCVGAYTVIVTDASSATVAVTVVITQPPALNNSVSPASTICPSACKTITANTTGGTPPYSYTWQPGNLIGGTQTVCPASSTTYTLFTSDSYSCMVANLTTVTVASPVANAGPTQSLTCINPNAVLNGSGVTTYSWTGPAIVSGANTPNPNVAAPGIYSLTGTVNGCVAATATVMVVNNTTPPNVSITASSSTICAGGSATLVASSGPYMYSWSTGANTSSVVVSPSASTLYTVVVTNGSNGCQAAVSQGIGVNSPTLTISTPSAVCAGATGCISVGGAISYTWAGPCGFSATQPTVCFPFSPACACAFSVTGTSSNGCTKTVTTCVNVTANPTVGIYTSDSLLCAGQSATLTAGGAASYSWSTNSTASVAVVSPTSNITYTVTGTSSAGCTGSAVFTQSVAACTSLNDFNSGNKLLLIHPNPFNDIITVQNSERYKIEIMNMFGELMLVREETEIISQYDLTSFAPGIYFVKAGPVKSKIIKR